MSTRMKNSTVIKEEIDKFSRMSEEWWDPNGKFKPLHKFNPIRVKYIIDNTLSHFKINKKSDPLNGLNILDVGCGGGLLTEPLSRLGANVIGIDASKNNIEVAKRHLQKGNLKIKYFCTTPEEFKSTVKFDVILNMEIVEHVQDLNLFLNQTSKFLKKNGLMYVATINKTLKSYLFAIIGAEYILKWLPIGTHDWDKFVKPNKLREIAKKNSLKFNKLDGVKLDLFLNKWKLSKDSSVNYISNFIKT